MWDKNVPEKILIIIYRHKHKSKISVNNKIMIKKFKKRSKNYIYYIKALEIRAKIIYNMP
jgi:hypothetical protein